MTLVLLKGTREECELLLEQWMQIVSRTAGSSQQLVSTDLSCDNPAGLRREFLCCTSTCRQQGNVNKEGQSPCRKCSDDDVTPKGMKCRESKSAYGSAPLVV